MGRICRISKNSLSCAVDDRARLYARDMEHIQHMGIYDRVQTMLKGLAPIHHQIESFFLFITLFVDSRWLVS